MARTRSKKTSNSSEHSFLRNEILGFISLMIAAFYYLCIFSFDPLDPSLFTSANHADITNLGGIFGSYLSGLLFFLFGGGSYFLGIYFVLQSIFFFANKENKINVFDFLIFFICTIFISTFLQLQFESIHIDSYAINAGGSLGKILGETGATFLGTWGVYLFVLFGVILTFIIATKLSFLRTLNTSTAALTQGVTSVGPKFLQPILFVLKKIGEAFAKIAKLPFQKSENDEESDYEDDDEEYDDDDELTEAVVVREERKAKTEEIEEEQEKKATVNIDQFLKNREKGPKILQRKEFKPKKVKKSTKNQQLELAEISKGFHLPTTDFLDYEEQTTQIDEASLKMSAKILEKKLKDFSIDGQVTEIHPGPIITMYEFQPAPGVKLSRINNLSDDLSLAMGGRPVRIVAPLPNKAAVGIEIPNHERETVWLKDIIESEVFQEENSKLTFALGKDISGAPFVSDLKKMPHLLVAGATGSGKSVSVNTMICSILYNARPDEVRVIMIDPKMIELSIYEGIPHLLLPVVTDPKKANLALKWCVREMEKRYQLLADANVRNVESYNKKWDSGKIENKEPKHAEDEPIIHESRLPFIVVIIDEFADLMMVSSKEVEESVCRLAQKARACGIHVILATQRPSVDVITGIIKANFPSRIAFKVTSKHDSRTIMDGVGAEHLLGQGDMLFRPPGASKLVRLHGAFVSEDEILKIVDFLKDQADPIYNEEILTPPEKEIGGSDPEDFDEYYDQAVREIARTKKVSISSIQRKFRIGYNRAARIVEQMEEEGVVSSPNSKGQREVLVQDV